MGDPQQVPRLGVSACVWREDRVLVIQRAKPPARGIWSLPGGGVELGETLRDAAARELLEETGTIADLTHLADIADVIRRNPAGQVTIHYAVACFTGQWISGEAFASSDALAVKWALIDELDPATFTNGTLEIIARAKNLLFV